MSYCVLCPVDVLSGNILLNLLSMGFYELWHIPPSYLSSLAQAETSTSLALSFDSVLEFT